MDIAEQVQQMRLVHRVEKDAERDLMHTEIMQGRRWDLLRRVAEYAGDSYTAMRIDNVDEKLRDQGATHWLSSILIVAVTLIPVSAMTTVFLAGLTTTTQKLLTRADRKLMQSAERFLETRFDSPRWANAAGNWSRQQDQIKRSDDMVATYVEKFLEPELISKLRNYRDALAKEVGKPPFGQADVPLLQGLEPILQGQGKQSIQKDVPVVQIKKSLDGWIDTQILAEDSASKKIRQQIRDLADIATSPDPAKEARAKKAEAMKEASKGPKVYGPPAPKVYGPPAPGGRAAEEPFPNTNKAALDQLKKLQKQLALTSVESTSTPSSEALWDLQLAIESIIWATTYDFLPIRKQINLAKDRFEPPRLQPEPYVVTLPEEPIPLPENLWKRLIERYPVPAGKGKGKTDKDKETKPDPAGKDKIDKDKETKLRLSNYFRWDLYPQINGENAAMVARLRALAPPTMPQ